MVATHHGLAHLLAKGTNLNALVVEFYVSPVSEVAAWGLRGYTEGENLVPLGRAEIQHAERKATAYCFLLTAY